MDARKKSSHSGEEGKNTADKRCGKGDSFAAEDRGEREGRGGEDHAGEHGVGGGVGGFRDSLDQHRAEIDLDDLETDVKKDDECVKTSKQQNGGVDGEDLAPLDQLIQAKDGERRRCRKCGKPEKLGDTIAQVIGAECGKNGLVDTGKADVRRDAALVADCLDVDEEECCGQEGKEQEKRERKRQFEQFGGSCPLRGASPI